MCSQAESEHLVFVQRRNRTVAKHCIDEMQIYPCLLFPLWLDEKNVVRSGTGSTVKKNGRKTCSQKWSVTWMFCLHADELIVYLCNWMSSGKSLFSAVDRTSTEAPRSAQNLIIHLFWWFQSINDLDKRLPGSFKKHAYFRLVRFNFLSYIQNYCHLTIDVIIEHSPLWSTGSKTRRKKSSWSP